MVCDTLAKCITYGLNYGLRSRGGIGDHMLEPNWHDPWAMPIVLFEVLTDLLLLLVIGGVTSALLFIAVKHYHALDSSKNNLRSVCFICGCSRLNFATQVTYPS